MDSKSVLLALVCLAGCHQPAPKSAAPRPATEAEGNMRARGEPLAKHPGIFVEVHGPSTVPYGFTELGLNASEITIVVHNGTAAPQPFGPVRARFTVRRDGVPFRCEPHDESHAREPRLLDPGQAFALTRMMHCWTPIPGRYDVQAYVALEGDAEYAQVGALSMEVLDRETLGPHEYPDRPGLYFAMNGDRRSPPIAMRRDGRQDGYHAVIVAANASRVAIAGGPLKVAFTVKKKGSPFVCGGETVARALPALLASGEVYTFRVPVTCIREELGEYVVTGQLAFDEPVGSEAIEIGRMGVRVTSDPLLLWPAAMP